MSYQWWIGKYLIIMQYFTALVFLNNVKAYILIESVILKGHQLRWTWYPFSPLQFHCQCNIRVITAMRQGQCKYISSLEVTTLGCLQKFNTGTSKYMQDAFVPFTLVYSDNYILFSDLQGEFLSSCNIPWDCWMSRLSWHSRSDVPIQSTSSESALYLVFLTLLMIVKGSIHLSSSRTSFPFFCFSLYG